MDSTVAAQPGPLAGRKLQLVLFALVLAIATALIVGTIRVRRAEQERNAIRRAWKLGTVILFEGDKVYTNPPFTPAEWDVELRRSWLDNLVAPSPTTLLFVRYSRVGWPRPIVNDEGIPELIEILRMLPTVRQVTLDKNTTPAGKTRLERALPAVDFRYPPHIP
jgi:hypothetical protein